MLAPRSGPRARQSPSRVLMSSVCTAAPTASASGREAGIRDQPSRSHLSDEAGELARGGGRVGRDGDRAEGGKGKPAQQVRRGGPRGDDDEVAPSHTGLGEPLHEPPDLAGRIGERQVAVVGAQPDAVGVAVGGGNEQPRDGVWHARPGLLRRRARSGAGPPRRPWTAAFPRRWHGAGTSSRSRVRGRGARDRRPFSARRTRPATSSADSTACSERSRTPRMMVLPSRLARTPGSSRDWAVSIDTWSHGQSASSGRNE